MRIRDIVLIGLLSAATTAGKLALSFIPNVEIVTLFFILFAVVLGMKRSLFVAVIFITTDILIYGFSTWVLGYYLVWPLVVIIASVLSKRTKSEYAYATLGGLFGLFFGLFFAITESFFYGPAYGLAYWVNGLTFDLIHGASNFIIVLLMFKPLKNMLDIQVAKLQVSDL
jgi:energy-coupling factor transport system substrate-specific component